MPGQAVHNPGRQDEPGQSIRNLPWRGEPIRRIHNLGRHDDVRMELLPEGILLFSGLRTHNVYAFARDGTCLLGSQGDPPVNILGQDRFELITDLAVGPGGERVYVIDYDGLVQGFERVRQ
jgi:hypothetical protein